MQFYNDILFEDRGLPLSVTDYKSFFKGVFSFRGVLRIQGHFKGNIIGGTLFIDKGASVQADVNVNNFICYGSFEGNVISQDRFILKAKSNFTGNVNANKVQIDTGSFFKGIFKMNDIKKEELALDQANEMEKLKIGVDNQSESQS